MPELKLWQDDTAYDLDPAVQEVFGLMLEGQAMPERTLDYLLAEFSEQLDEGERHLAKLLNGPHYRELASKLREIARQCRFPGARKEILDLALRYERRADHFDVRSSAARSVQDPG